MIFSQKIQGNIELAVKSKLCIGCGLCALACKTGAIEIKKESKQYVASVDNQRCTRCQACLRVCPMTKHNLLPPREALSAVKNHECFAGNVVNEPDRLASSSGGLLTEMLVELINNGKINAALCVIQTSMESHPYFVSAILDNESKIRAAASTKYYPIEFSHSLSEAVNSFDTIAVVALPCAARAIKSLMKSNKRYNNSIKYVFGLVCNHNKNFHFTDWLLQESRYTKKPEQHFKLSYREKKKELKATDYSFCIRNNNGDIEAELLASQSKYGKVWPNRFLKLPGCDYCSDVFANYADIVFMDAWLPQYIKDGKGSSLVVSRNDDLSAALQSLKQKGRIVLDPVSPDDILRSQQYVIMYKVNELPIRLWPFSSKQKILGVKGRRPKAKWLIRRLASRFLLHFRQQRYPGSYE